MASVTFTPNLKLRLDSNLTANSRYNLERLDGLGSTFIVDTTNTLNVRSITDIVIEPESATIGGSGVGGQVSIGTPSHQISALSIYASTFNVTNVGLQDQATGGTRYLHLKYKSDLNSSVDTAADRNLFVDLDGADRNLVLGGNLSISGGSLALTLSGSTSLSLPLTGTLSTLSGVESLTNKTIDASSNTIINITDTSISSSAGIAYSKLNLASSVLGSDISPSAAIPYSKLTLTASLVDSDISSGALISRAKLASGAGNQVVINDGLGKLTSEAFLATSRGGTGISSTASFPTSGVVLSDSNTATVTNKTLSGSLNTLLNIGYSSLLLTNSVVNSDISSSAAISYSKLNLSNSLVNADVSTSAAISYSKLNLALSIVDSDVSTSAALSYSKLNLTGHIVDSDVSSSAAISGTKINPNFGNQLIQTDDALQYNVGGYATKLRAAPSGQTVDLDFRLPNSAGTAGQVISTDGSGILSWVSVGGTGTVTSVALTAPAELAVTGSPITGAGTLALSWANETANTVLAGPTSGSPGTPSFRALGAMDLQVVGYRKESAAWITADGTTKTVTHGWGTQKISVEILDNSANYATIDVSSITRPTSNTVVITATEAPASTWTVLLSEVP